MIALATAQGLFVPTVQQAPILLPLSQLNLSQWLTARFIGQPHIVLA